VFPTELLRSTQFRLAAAFVAGTALVSLLLFAFVYWQTASFISHRVRVLLEQEAVLAVGRPEADIAQQVTFEIANDSLHVIYNGLFAPDGRVIAGNLGRRPSHLPPDGRGHRLRGEDYVPDLPPSIFAIGVARRLANGDIMVLTRDVAVVESLRDTVLRALGLGLVPAFGLLLAIGLLLGRRALARVKTVHRTIERIMRGDLHERLPVASTHDDIDSLARSVNRMLDELERLLHEVKGVGDNIAHELRTPLARARARLERGRNTADSLATLRQSVDHAIADLDQAVALVRGLMRVAEIESSLRRSAFGTVDLAELAREVHDLFQPLAEEQGRSLTLREQDIAIVQGDSELLMEAIANLVDNALKYTSPGGSVWVGATCENGHPAILVADNGPGIPAEERSRIFNRFYRVQRGNLAPGHGLGLSIVEAIARLHDFRMEVRSAPEGGALFVMVADAPVATDRDHRAAPQPAPPLARQEPV
jgi:signal transduction histidine kinase